jgi:hypothetical protein
MTKISFVFDGGTITIPNTADGLELMIKGRNVFLEPPGMAGAHTQQLGSELSTLSIGCDLDMGDWTRAGDTVDGQVFFEMIHKLPSIPYVAVTLPPFGAVMNMTLQSAVFSFKGGPNQAHRSLRLEFVEYYAKDPATDTYKQRFGIT